MNSIATVSLIDSGDAYCALVLPDLSVRLAAQKPGMPLEDLNAAGEEHAS